MAQTKRWIAGLVFCFLLAASEASATYVVIENVSQNAPNFGDCNCLQATGWLGGILMYFTVVESDGTTYDLFLTSSQPSTPRNANTQGGNAFVLDVTKTNPVAPGGSYTSKKIVGLPDSGFTFTSRNASIGVYYCKECIDACGGYSTGMTDVWPNGLFIKPGMLGSDSFEFQVPAAGSMNGPSVVRVTFYPGNPPSRGKGK